jgi:DNA-binding beta-propeller fold protein YncE
MIPTRFHFAVTHLSALVAAALILTATAARADEVTVVTGDNTPAPATGEPKGDGLNIPFGVDFDPQGDLLIAEYIGGRVFRLHESGKLERLAGTGGKGYRGDGGPAHEATFDAIHNLAVTPDGDIFLSDHANHVVRRIDAESGNISTFAGTGKPGFSGDGGPADQARFNVVMCVTLSPDGSQMLIADLGSRRIRSIDMASGSVTTLAGNGKKGVPRDGQPALESPLVDPRAAAMDKAGNLYIVERNGHALRVVRPSGLIETVAGTGARGDKDGPALQAQLSGPKHLAIDEAGKVYIADDLNHTIRQYDPSKNTLVTVLGKGEFKLKRPHGVTIREKALYVVDSYHHRVLKMPLP